jgi:hypothetical protein
VFAVLGRTYFGVAGVITGEVIGDAHTDGIAGFFEGSTSKLLMGKGLGIQPDFRYAFCHSVDICSYFFLLFQRFSRRTNCFGSGPR